MVLRARPRSRTHQQLGRTTEPAPAKAGVRPGVLWCKTCFGTQSDNGSRFVERIMTVVATLKQQKRNGLDFLTEACDSANNRRRLTVPSAPQQE